MSLPTFTLVTPSYNQGRFLERTLRSVLAQRYPFVEYVVMDGGSTDGSLAILERYAPLLTHWQSGRDGGQASAILDGLARGSGALLGFVNSDDVLLPDALWEVARWFERHPDEHVLVGNNLYVDEDDRVLGHGWAVPPAHEALLLWGCGFAQPASFWTRRAFDEVGGFDGSLRFSFDLDLFLRLTARHRAHRLDRHLAAVRNHRDTKTATLADVCTAENATLREREGLARVPAWRRALVPAGLRLQRGAVAQLQRFGLRAGLTAPFDPAAVAAWLAWLRASDGVLGGALQGADGRAGSDALGGAGEPGRKEGAHVAAE